MALSDRESMLGFMTNLEHIPCYGGSLNGEELMEWIEDLDNHFDYKYLINNHFDYKYLMDRGP